jgi:predicted glycoside hydrolase/deacetylase ChbG (UPF0249 family)
MTARRLIVNADDFGLSAGVNRGIAQAHEHGIVTSASLMVRGPAAEQAATYARAHPRLSVGLHIDLAEWRYTNLGWVAAYEVVALDDPAAVAAEVVAQLRRFSMLTGATPTHLDSHQHVHRDDPVRTVVLAHGQRLGVPVRDHTPDIRYFGGFYGQASHGKPWPEGITVKALCKLLQDLPQGTTELGCHPGLDDDSGSPYSHERTVETATLCDPQVLAAVHEQAIQLDTFP